MYREVFVVLQEKKKGAYVRQEEYSLHHFALGKVSKIIWKYDRAERKRTEDT